MKGIYLAAGRAYHHNYNILYQDIDGKRDISGDMMDIDLSQYDFIIASPPCNFWSRARGKKISKYSIMTKHLLPDILEKLINLDVPFIVENVWNKKRFLENGILPCDKCFVYRIGRHIYFSNVLMKVDDLYNLQRFDFNIGGYVVKYDDMDNKYMQGGYNVHIVVQRFLETIHSF